MQRLKTAIITLRLQPCIHVPSFNAVFCVEKRSFLRWKCGLSALSKSVKTEVLSGRIGYLCWCFSSNARIKMTSQPASLRPPG